MIDHALWRTIEPGFYASSKAPTSPESISRKYASGTSAAKRLPTLRSFIPLDQTSYLGLLCHIRPQHNVDVMKGTCVKEVPSLGRLVS
jgi:hypothetical protein